MIDIIANEYYKNVTSEKGCIVKKLVVIFLIFIAGFLYWAKVPDPLNAFFSFIIGGDVPGTSIVLGFWPTIGLGLLGLLILKKFTAHIRLQSLEYTSKEIKNEIQKEEFKNAHQHEFDKQRRSVIAGPSSELAT